jgi:hypothetical protein
VSNYKVIPGAQSMAFSNKRVLFGLRGKNDCTENDINTLVTVSKDSCTVSVEWHVGLSALLLCGARLRQVHQGAVGFC